MTLTARFAPEERFHNLDKKISLDCATFWKQEAFSALRELKTQE